MERGLEGELAQLGQPPASAGLGGGACTSRPAFIYKQQQGGPSLHLSLCLLIQLSTMRASS